jgi:L-iditol 2-dehydrogenase
LIYTNFFGDDPKISTHRFILDLKNIENQGWLSRLKNKHHEENTMKAAVLLEPGKMEIKEVPRPEPGPLDVIIENRMVGICGSDYSVFRGNLPASLPLVTGHETVGRIAALGSEVTGLSLDQRVTIQPNYPCRTCGVCLAGHENICPQKVRLGGDVDGVFADFVRVPANFVWPVPDNLKTRVAVFTEPLAVAVHALRLSPPNADDRVLIFGSGVIGLLVLQLAALQGAAVSAFDLVKEKSLVVKELGGDALYHPDTEMESLESKFDLIYETSGAAGALAQCLDFAAPKARIIVLGLGAEYPLAATKIVRKELQIMGSMIYTDEFQEALSHLEAQRVKTEPLVTETLPLTDLPKALGSSPSKNRLKILIDMK